MATNPAHLSAMMAKIGLPDAFYARRFGCDAKTVWNWRNGRQIAPPRAVLWIIELAKFFRDTPAPRFPNRTGRLRDDMP